MGLTVGELVAFLDLDANPFTKNLDRAMRDGEAAGKRMDQVGGKLTRNLTLPMLAAGGAALKLGGDFETSFARMVGLAGVPADEVERLKGEVLDLSGKTAVAPQELADALYFAASAGLDAAGAMDAVTLAAQASAAGMGSAQDIVGLVASAVANYGAANIDAARATDILTAAVREGRADPDELAGALGRILPFAAKLRVSFDEVAGTVAFLSNSFGDTNRAVTAAQGLFIKLQSPTEQGRKALADMGTSAEELQAAIDQDGLLGAMELLKEKGFAENNQAMTKLFDDIEGRSAALAIMGDESGALAGILEETAGSAGDLGTALGEVMGTDAFKGKQAVVDLQVALVQLGQQLLPIAADVAAFASTVFNWFSGLPEPGRKLVVILGGILAVSGPLITAGGRLLGAWNLLSKVAERFVTSGADMSTAFQTAEMRSTGAATGTSKLGKAMAALGFAGAIAGAVMWARTTTDLELDVDALAAALADLSDAEADQMQQTIRIVEQWGDLDEMVRRTADSNVIAADRLLEQAEAAGITGDRLDELKAIVDGKRQADVQGAEDQETYRKELEQTTTSTEEQIPAVDKLAEAYDGLLEAVLAQFDADVAYRRSIDSTEDSLAGLVETQKEHGTNSEEYRRALLDAEDAMLGQATAAVELATKQAEATGSMLTAEEKARVYREQLAFLAQSLEPGSELRSALEGHIATLDAIPGQVETVVTADMTPAERAIREFLAQSFTAHIKMVADNPQGGTAGLQVRDHGGPILGPKGSPQMVLGHAGEVVLPTHRMGLGDALQQTLGISSAPSGSGGKSTVIEGDLVVQTNDSPREWFDEGLWRVGL